MKNSFLEIVATVQASDPDSKDVLIVKSVDGDFFDGYQITLCIEDKCITVYPSHVLAAIKAARQTGKRY